MNAREAERYLAALAEVRATGQPAATATVVRVHGSAYRREGARMLVRADGTYECALSGGCLEPAVAEAAARVLATGQPAMVTYDLADDSIWGLDIGCTGAVDIRIERVDDDSVTTAWHEVLRHGEAAVRITPLSGIEGRRLVRATGATLGTLSAPEVQRLADARARELLAADTPLSTTEAVAQAQIFFEVHLPPPELVIFGAGQDAVPLARHAWTLGHAVTVVDPREAYLQPDLFSGARLVLAPFDELAAAAPLGPDSFAVVMSHHMGRDRLALRHCFAAAPAYIGVLGPRARYERLRADLAAEGVVPADDVLRRVHSPIGLALGAETPEEVALSILAEMLAVRRGFAGGFLRGHAGSLHRSDATRATARS
jgi:xanthine/CO dehydrogenase XdhC/CoxF family maturation factor